MASDMTPIVEDHAFELTEFFEGRTRARGLFADRFGTVRRRFTAELDGRWTDSQFLLEESFVFDDGETDHRLWRFSVAKAGSFTATCRECIGTAIGELAAGSATMSYRFRLQLKSRVLEVSIEDRFRRIDCDTVSSRASVRKWGVKLGELSVVFKRSDGAPSRR
jgi:hypothetical protein